MRDKEYTIPSFFVPLPFDRFDIDLVNAIIRFLCEHTTSTKTPRYVLKFPFVTNSEGLKFPRSFPDVFEKLLTANEKFFIENDRLPYAILQPCLRNRKEKKCVMLNGRFHYFAKIHVTTGPQKKFAADKALPAIAELYLQELVSRCPGTIVSGLVRVDLMSYNNRIVVNEFESLEAMYCPENRIRDSNKAMNARSFLVDYWIDIVINRVFGGH